MKTILLVSMAMLMAFNLTVRAHVQPARGLSIGSTGTVVLYQDTSQYSGQGGEGAFMLYSSQINNGVGTLTLCLQDDVSFTPCVQYNFTVNYGSVGSMVGVDAKDLFTDRPMNSLTLGTAWLFSQFSAGTLPGFDYSFGPGFTQSATRLEYAINDLQGYPTTAGGEYFVNLAEQSLGLDANGIMGNANGAYGVGVLNLYDSNRNPAQNQLVMLTSAPEPSTWAFVCLICLVLAVARRNVAGNKAKKNP